MRGTTLTFSVFKDIVDGTEEQRRTFFKLTFGPEATGYLCIAFLGHTTRKMQQLWFEYPKQLDEMLVAIDDRAQDLAHFWFSSALYEKPGNREKQYAKLSTIIHCDLDTCDPRLLLVPPSILVQSSPGRYQALWLLDNPVQPAVAEDVNRRIAYYHRDQGADTCHDAGHLLRIPYTPNYKYGEIGTAPVVAITHAERKLYRVSDFKQYPNIAALKFMDKEQDNIPNLPIRSAEEILEGYRESLHDRFWTLYRNQPKGDTSRDLWHLMKLCLEAGMERGETFIVARESACNKYARDQRPDIELWRDVLRTYVKNIEKMQLAPTSDSTIPQLLTSEEVQQVQARPTFVERYIQWAKGLTDAPVQYHQAGAFVILSALLSGNVYLSTSHSKIHPNMWFMILAGTTLTRKSTANRIAMNLLREVDDRAEMATDGSIEGLLVGLRDRPGQPSIFLRDEFTGLLDAIAHKEYMAGFAEQLTKLYDGDDIKRLLRKETIHVKDPRFIILAAGIKEKTQMLLTEEHVMSGFVPRFVFVSGDADPDRLQPTGPPRQDESSVEKRDMLRNELFDLAAHYINRTSLTRDGRAVGNIPLEYEATLTSEAWVRFQAFEKLMRDTALDTGLGYLVPVYERLSTSTLKAALLLAASRQRVDGVVVEELDILHAIYYAQRWREYASEIVNGIGKTYDERLIDKLLAYIRSSPSGASRAELMNVFRLDMKRADTLFGTMAQRNMVHVLEVQGNRRYRAMDGAT